VTFTDDGYEPDGKAAIRDSLEDSFDQETVDSSTAPGTIQRAFIVALAAELAGRIEPAIAEVYDDAFLLSADGEALTRKAREYGVVRRDAQRATGVVTFSRDSNATQDYPIQSETVVSTGGPDAVRFETTETVTLPSGTQSVDATVQAVEGGTDGNVAPNAIDTMPNGVTGIDDVSNAQATGDPTLTDTSGNALRRGLDRESDSELRDRALDDKGFADAASVSSIRSVLTNVEDVISVTLNVNATSTDNSGSGGLEPYSIEPIVYGGSDSEVAEAIAETVEVLDLLRLQSGIDGSAVSPVPTYDSPTLDQTVDVPFSRPNVVSISDVDVTVVYEGDYAGDDAVTDAIVGYIGGTRTDGSRAVGTPLGEDVVVDELDSNIVDVGGVVAATSLTLDVTNNGSDDTTTDADGIEVLSVASNEVYEVDASNITVTSNQRS
jgi:uncharacterized phage protein gp47/JayE